MQVYEEDKVEEEGKTHNQRLKARSNLVSDEIILRKEIDKIIEEWATG
jgi:hypothetical protein